MSDLQESIREEIRASGPMGFDVFMERALYDPEGGYYAAGAGAIGRQGDFFTSVSVGGLFGELLGEQVAETWDRMGRPAAFDVVEQGGHDGRLASDLLEALERRHRGVWRALCYRIVEPLESLRRAQAERLEERWGEKVGWAGGLEEGGEFAGVFLCNELVDALPCRRVRFDGEQWRELCVGLAPEAESFCWVEGEEVAAEVKAESHLLGGGSFPRGYTTEIRPAVSPWMRSLAAAMRQGVALIVDYGFGESEFFEEGRREGTLQCYSKHRVDVDPFTDVGERDISAHVNFSRLAREAEEQGLEIAGFVDQSHFLVGAGRLLIEEREGKSDAVFARQFQTLAHPGMMGRVFKVLALSRGLDLKGEPLAGFGQARALEI